jgi:Zn-dependent alcohol dehydrogenase
MAVLVGCGVPTGWGSAVNTANVAPGDMVAVYGVGGIGINAVQGARYAGAKNVVAIVCSGGAARCGRGLWKRDVPGRGRYGFPDTADSGARRR